MLHLMTFAELDIPGAQSTVFTALIEEFAHREIEGRDDLRDYAIIPPDLWRAIGAASLARIGLPMAYGGVGGGFRALASAAESMTAAGGVMGVTTSWLGRQLVSRLQILGHGSAEQRQTYLPALTAGRLTACLAISEPKAGAHPKHLATTAERDGDNFILNGEKAYVTNGPIADLFLVLAITGMYEQRKRFSILIVPRDTPGLILTEGIKIDFLHPAPHCGLRFKNVRVPVGNLLGPEGNAFEAISIPMRRVEDALSLATVAGATRHQIEKLGHEINGTALDDTTLTELGNLAAAPDGLSALASRAADLLDADGDPEEITRIAAVGKDWARMTQKRIRTLAEQNRLPLSVGLTAEGNDLEKSLGIARSAHIIQAQRRAKALLTASAS